MDKTKTRNNYVKYPAFYDFFCADFVISVQSNTFEISNLKCESMKRVEYSSK